MAPADAGGNLVSRRAVPVPPLPTAFMARGFGWYLDRLAAKHFSSVRWSCQEDPGRWHQGPLLLVANHTNWWDGFLAHQVTRALGLHFQILMDAKGVAAYPVFKRFGAVPVRRGSAAGSVADLHAVGQNLRPGVAVWIFPQGERRPQGARVARCEHGAAHLALARERVRIVPVAIRYPFLGEQLPEGFLLLGGSWLAGRAEGPAGGREARQALTAEIERRLNEVVAALDARLAAEAVGEFRTLVQGRLSINKRMDRVRHATGMLEGPFEERNG
jgi:1-acyl-sn-glycerol-3-phosphate acyltransferase